MPRYIDADNFNNFDYSDFDGPLTEDAVQGIETVLRAIDSAPTADVQEVKHGTWIDVGRDVFECSSCKSYRIRGCFIPKPRYCGNCGARMNGDNK